MITPEALRDEIHEIVKASAPLMSSIKTSQLKLAELSQQYHQLILARLAPGISLTTGTLIHQIPIANSPNKTEAELKTITDRWPDIQWTQVIYDKQRQTFYLFANV